MPDILITAQVLSPSLPHTAKARDVFNKAVPGVRDTPLHIAPNIDDLRYPDSSRLLRPLYMDPRERLLIIIDDEDLFHADWMRRILEKNHAICISESGNLTLYYKDQTDTALARYNKQEPFKNLKLIQCTPINV